MDKKWSCPACEYKSGRGSNVARHIDRKLANYGVPVLTKSRHTILPDSSWYNTDQYFLHTRQDFAKDILDKKKVDSFISSYKFEDKKLGMRNF